MKDARKSSSIHRDIAVVGLACRFPGASDWRALWRNIAAGTTSTAEVPRDRWDWRAVCRAYGLAEPDSSLRWGGFMDAIDRFDAGFFGVSPREAHNMDPQQRILLELAWACFEDAGYVAGSLAGGSVGVFIGACNYDYKELQDRRGASIEGHILPGTAGAILPNRISHFFDLHGPSVAVDTACASSLFALHDAIRSLRDGECELALAGGISVLVCGDRYVPFVKLGMLSTAGRCSTFDAAADGYVRAEGAGLILLKPLDRALADGDFIYGVLKGSATNHGGRARTLTSPNPFLQARVIAEAWRRAGAPPETAGYIEAHGTGTPLGDPIELTGLRRAFTQLAKADGSELVEGRCGLGSLKANIGHSEGAAGVAGVIKVLLALKHATLPPMAGFTALNPRIKLDGSPFFVVERAQAWPAIAGADGTPLPRRAGVSSFGFGGANAHVVVEEHVPAARAALAARPVVVPLSAKSPERLREAAAALARLVADAGGALELSDLAHTLQVGREAMASRAAIVCAELGELEAALAAIAGGEPVAAPRAGGAHAELAAVAAQWSAAGTVDWQSVGATGGRRIPLPTYPFAREPYWLRDLRAEAPAGEPAVGVSPLAAVGASPAGPTAHASLAAADAPAAQPPSAGDAVELPGRGCGEHLRCRVVTLTAADARLADHVVDGRAIAPGALLLDLVAQIALPGVAGLRFADVAWQRPVEAGELHVVLTPQAAALGFELVSSSVTGGRRVHASGTVAALAAPAPALDLAALRARCARPGDDAEAHYRALAGTRLAYGGFYRVLAESARGDGEALVTVRAAADSPSLLRPDLLDGALQAVTTLVDLSAEGVPLPAGLDELRAFRRLPARGLVHVVRAGAAAGPAGPAGIDRFDLTIADESGEVCAELRGLIVCRRAPAAPSWFYRPTWWPLSAAPTVAAAAEQRGQVLIVGRASERALISALADAEGWARTRVVILGEASARRSLAEWTLAPGDAAGLDACLDGLGEVSAIHFLGAIEDRDADPGDLAALDRAQQRGPLLLLSLVHALERRGLMRAARLRVVTRDAAAVTPEDAIVPHGAAAVGAALCLGRERPALAVACVDLPSGASLATAVTAIVRPDLAPRAVTAMRGDAHLVRGLEPAALSGGELGLRQCGAYLILGGASGIGLETAVLLARQARARLVLVGRRPTDETVARAIERVRAAGGEALYLSADATSRRDMERVRLAARAAFGPLHGAVHSAVTLADAPLERMDLAAWRQAASVKLDASVLLAEITAGEPLDFLLFYSSAVAFRGNFGQANYAAGCSFQDALAAQLRRAGRNVKVVNWGFWGDTGIVATESHRKKLAQLGIHAIGRAEGVDAIARLIAGAEPQVVAVRAEREALVEFGLPADDGAALASAGGDGVGPAPASRDGVAAGLELDAIAGLGGEDARALAAQAPAFREFEALSALGLYDALGRAGAFADGGEPRSAEELGARIGVTAGYRRFLGALLELLARAGYLERSSSGRIGVAPLARDPATAARIAGLDDSFAALAVRQPDCAPHVRLLAATLAALPEVLSGRRPATEVIFAADLRGELDRVYRDGAVGAYCRFAARTVRALAQARQGGRPVRVVEIGAGTGGASGPTLAALAELAPASDYLYTDVSRAFLRMGSARFGARYGFVRFAELDIERDLAEQGLSPGSADIVLAANVLHATRDIGEALRHIAWLLAPGGQLVLCETRAVQLFTTLTFGLLDGWWRFTDDARRLPHSPLLDGDGWRRALGEHGFGAPAVATLTSSDEPLAQCLVVATRDAVAAGQLKENEAMSEIDLRAALVEAIVDELARGTLRAAATIDPARPFAEFGVDSIVSTDVAQGLSKALGVAVKTTSFFEFPTAAALAAHLCEAHPAEVRARFGGRPAAASTTAAPAPVAVAHPAAASPAPTPSAGAPSAAAPVRATPIASPAPATASLPGHSGDGALGVVLHTPSNLAEVRLAPIAVAPPAAGEVQIATRAFALNFGDLLCVRGLYPTMPPYPFVPGFELAGVVRAVGAGVDGLQEGDEVIALTGAGLGGQATLVNVPAALTVHKPRGLGFAEASALPVAFVTAFAALDKAQAEPGECVLVQTGAGGVGAMAIQLAKLRGLEIFATAGSPAKCERLRSWGVAHAIDYRARDFAAEVRAITDGKGVDIVLNTLPGDALEKGLSILAPGGRYVEIAMTALMSARAVDLSRLVANQSLHSVDLRRTALTRPARVRRMLEEMVALVEAGRIQANVGNVLAAEELAGAYRLLDGARNVGKVVVMLPEREAASPPRVAASAPVAGATPEPIAIIGAAGRFPGAADLPALWHNLVAGVNAITAAPDEAWPFPVSAVAGAGAGRAPGVQRGGFLDAIDCFDPLFFRLSGTEATLMDPQHRLLLQECWKALEDAAVAPTSLDGRACGVFVGAAPGDYADVLAAAGERIEGHTFTGNEASVGAARIAYFLNLKGPALAVSTACSSSLVAIHYACQSLRAGECELALAGGVFVNTTPRFHLLSSRAGMLSPSGQCRAFDADADGFVPGEGVGVLVLKPLSRALADGDPIRAVIRASGVNQDGRTSGITAPSTAAQAQLVESVQASGDVDPASIGLVECHGTGTPLGDPIEIEALTRAFRKQTAQHGFCAVGSIKTNIGHAVTAAGVAGVLKVMLAMEQRTLPPSLGFARPNPRIEFGSSPFYVCAERAPWPGGAQPRRAAVSSFGFSGTNAHLILEEAPPWQRRAGERAVQPQLFCLSAVTQEALEQRCVELAAWLGADGRGQRPVDLAYTLLCGRAHHTLTLAIVARDLDELALRLDDALAGRASSAIVRGSRSDDPRQRALDGVRGQELLARARRPDARAESLVVLAELYARGAELDWRPLFDTGAVDRLRLPGYPFAQERYWPRAIRPRALGVAADRARTARLHSLVHRRSDDGDRGEAVCRFQTLLSADACWARDHLIGGRPVLAGAALIEMARAAVEATGAPAGRISRAAWLAPLVVDGAAIELAIDVERGTADARCRVYASGGSLPCFEADVEAGPAAAPPPLSLAAIRARAPQLLDGDTCRQRLARAGLVLGPTFHGLAEVARGSDEALATLCPVPGADDASGLVLHPSLLDGAWQAMTALIPDEEAAAFRPFLLEELVWYAPLARARYAHVVRQACDNPRQRRFALTLTDELGAVLAMLRGFVVARGSETAVAARGADEPSATLYFEPSWQPRELGAALGAPPRRTLVIDEDDRLRGALQTHLAAPVEHLATASCADERALAAALASGPELIVLRWTAGEAAETTLERALAPVLRVTQALARARTSTHLMVVRAAAATSPLCDSLAGLLRTLTLEQPGCSAQLLDVAPTEVELLAARIGAERAAFTPGAREVRDRGGRRHVRAIAEWRPAGEPVPAWRSDGLYLVTGGAGGIGRRVVEQLVGDVRARVVVAGRSTLDGMRRAWLDGVIARGGRVSYERVDVTRRAEVQALIERVRRGHGPLDGVVHAAGVLDDQRLAAKDPRAFAAVVAPKLLGAVHLDEAIGAAPLDAFILFSSLAGLVGNAGQADYALANRFLIAFAEQREALCAAGARHGRTLAVAWSLWADGGFALSEAARAQLAAAGLRPLPTETGLTALAAALARHAAVVAVAHGDAARLRALLAPVTAAPIAAAPIAGVPAAGELALLRAAEQLVRDRFADTLRIPPGRLRSDEPFERYGIDSIMATRLVTRLESDLGELPRTLLFEHHNIASLARHLAHEHRDQVAALLPQPAAAVVLPPQPAAAVVLPPQPIGPRDADAPSPVATAAAGANDIAIIGLAGRYPQAIDLDAFWQNLAAGRDCIEPIPIERWDHARYFDADRARRDRSYGKWGGFVPEHDRFDPLFFHISPREAEVMDPQERLFLETAWAALEDAGYCRASLRRLVDRRVGVFVGVMWSDYQLYGVGDGADGHGQRLSSSYASIANRVSFVLDLVGASMAIDTMCSSSLTALALACQSLLRGECAQAIAGGVNLSLHPNKYLYLAQERFLASDGRCRAFGDGGDGYVPGEGVGAVVLKPLGRALADGDHVYGVVKAAVLNHGGMTNGYTVPSAEAQSALVRTALESAGIDPASLGYLEAHGTGTELGDPIELRALARALGPRPDGSACAIGSVKSNIGHLESAAGIAGLTKVLLQLRHRQLVPSLHAEVPNRNVDFAKLPLRVQRQLAAWEPIERGDGAARVRLPRRAGISAFGAGGANAHVIVEESPAGAGERAADEPGAQLLILSAMTEERLLAYARRILVFITRARAAAEAPALADIAFTLQVGREAREERLAIITDELGEWGDKLARFIAGERDVPGLFRGRVGDGTAMEGAPVGGAVSLEALAAAWVASPDEIDWSALHAGRRRRVPLPTYPFARRRCWAPRAADGALSEPRPLAPAARTPRTPPAHSPAAYCVIGGGPSGLGVAKCLVQRGLPVEIIEREDDFGGVWNAAADSGRVYGSTHLISTKLNTQFSDYPMPAEYPVYPHHSLFLRYLRDLGQHFGLYERARFGLGVEQIEPAGGDWRIRTSDGHERLYRGVIVANGLQREPVFAELHGRFTGEVLHSAEYRDAARLRGKRVLVLGGGNSGCDIAVDVASKAAAVVHSMRRPYHFMPKFIAGRPTQEWLMDLPRLLGKDADVWAHVQVAFKQAGFDPTDYGLPAPDYRIDQAHPVINSHYLCHVGQGDIVPRPDVRAVDGRMVRFVDGTSAEVDVVLHATGYRASFPFLRDGELGWVDDRPDLFLRMFHRAHEGLFFIGFVNAAAGLGNVVNAKGGLLAAYLQARHAGSDAFRRFRALAQGPDPDLGAENFIKTRRHAYEVDLWKLVRTLSFFRARLEGGLERNPSVKIERVATAAQ